MTKHRVDTVECDDHQACFRITAELGAGPRDAHVSYVIRDCAEHPGCVEIITRQDVRLASLDGLGDEERAAYDEAGIGYEEDGPLVWFTDPLEASSHMGAEVHPEHRLNEHYPRALDTRGKRPPSKAKVISHTPPCADCAPHFG
jgi:hypothetical protein